MDEGLLRLSLSLLQAFHPQTPDIRAQAPALATAQQHAVDPVFVSIIAAVFAQRDLLVPIDIPGPIYQGGQLVPVSIRQVAAFLLKNVVFPRLGELSVNVSESLLDQLAIALADPQREIRATSANLLARFADGMPFPRWSRIFDMIVLRLMSALSNQSPEDANFVEGSMIAIKNICEDAAEKLSMDNESRPLEKLLPLLVQLTTYSVSPAIRVQALESINALLYLLCSGSQAMLLARIVPDLLGRLGHLAHDESPPVRKCVVAVITSISIYQIALLDTQFQGILQFVISMLQDSNDEVVMESCGFWDTIINNIHNELIPPTAIASVMDQLIPSLIGKLRLTVQQINHDRHEDELTSKSGKENNNLIRNVIFRNNGMSRKEYEAMQAEIEELSEMVTVRKRCAAVLDALTLVVEPQQLSRIALPIVNTLLNNSTDCWAVESGLLALGIVAGVCCDLGSLDEQQVIGLLQGVSQVCRTNETQELRAIAVWTISRFADWFFAYKHANDGDYDEEDEVQVKSNKKPMIHVNSGPIREEVMGQILDCLMQCISDTSPRVQYAVWSCISVICDRGQESMIPHVNKLLTPFIPCFRGYGTKARITLIDSVAALAEATGSQALSDPAVIQLFLPLVMDLVISQCDLGDILLLTTLESLVYILEGVQQASQPYALPLYAKCLQVLNHILSTKHKQQQQGGDGDDDDEEMPSNDLVFTILDVLTTIFEIFHDNVSQIISETQSAAVLVAVINACLADNSPQVKQSCLGLIGEIIGAHFALFRSDLHLMQHIVNSVLQCQSMFLEDHPAVASNASWVMGEILMNAERSECMEIVNSSAFKLNVFHNLVGSLEDNNTPIELVQNAAVLIGKCCFKILEDPQQQQHSTIIHDFLQSCSDETFFKAFCRALQTVEGDYQERDVAFLGLGRLVRCVPNIIYSVVGCSCFLRALTVYHEPTEVVITDLVGFIAEIITHVQTAQKNTYTVACSHLKKKEKRLMSEVFRIKI